jgi:hypothetical protein
VPSVTQVLSDLSIYTRMDPVLVRDARDRGRAVHLAVQLHNENDLDESSVDPSIAGYLRGWRRFCKDYDYEPIANEEIVFSERWGYAGKLDTLGRWKQPGRRRPMVVIDVKTGAADPVHGPQTAAYLEPLKARGRVAGPEMPQRAVVRVRANGLYDVDLFHDPADWSTFLAALTCFKFKERHGLL